MEMDRYASNMKRVGILGGTFDPVHNAHLVLARAALSQAQLDCILFIPTGLPVRKLTSTEASPLDRLNMLQIACEDTKEFIVSSIEIDRPQITYTIDTLRELKLKYGAESELFLVLGEDTARDIPTWKEASEIAKLAQVLYAKRPGGTNESNELPQGFTFFEIDLSPMDLSSSFIRMLLHEGEDVSAYVPTKVLSYIKEHRLYGQS